MIRIRYQTNNNYIPPTTTIISQISLDPKNPSPQTIYLGDFSVKRIRIIDVETDRSGVLAALAELLCAFEGAACYGDGDGGVGEDLEGGFGDETAAEEECFSGGRD